METVNHITAIQKSLQAKSRKQTADTIRNVRNILKKGCSPLETSEKKFVFPASMVIGSIVLGVLMLIGAFLCSSAHADQIPSEKAILSIIGEAENQGYDGMLAVACAIRNRGTLKGVYGLNAPRVKNHKYTEETYGLAKLAWQQSRLRDITRGATHWESKDFDKPYWSKNMKVTFILKKHVFYKEA